MNEPLNSSSVQQQALIEHWQRIRQELDAADVKLLAVSKYAPDAAVEMLIRAGERNFAESRPQQLRDRALRWPDCAWHMIGPTQKNKAKYIGRHAAVWHSCDDVDMARKVASFVEHRTLPVLMQVNIAANPAQRGVPPDQVLPIACALQDIAGIRLIGLMGMAPRLSDAGEGGVRASFQQLRVLRDQVFGGRFGELCIGMSSDYHIAIGEGATMVRLGTSLFDRFQTDSIADKNEDTSCNN